MHVKRGLNEGAYRGETIEIEGVLREILAEAKAHGWAVETMGRANSGLFALKRPSSRPWRKFYLSAGLHGDEPAGPLAALELVRLDQWPADAELWLCPCLNPTGFPLNRRENAQGVDLNRDYLQPATAEVQAHVAWLERQPRFDICAGLHEDWESQGFYLYETTDGSLPSKAEAVIAAVARICPIDESPIIEGRPACGGVIRPSLDPRQRPRWPEAFYLACHKTNLCYTLEAPSDFHLPLRVAALTTAAQTIFT